MRERQKGREVLEKDQQGHTIVRERTERWYVVVREGHPEGRITKKYRGTRWKRKSTW